MKIIMHLFYCVPTLFLHCFMVSFATTLKNITVDQSALLAFKAHVIDSQSVLAYNWSISYPICNWAGVSCGYRHERVTALNLSHMGLGGTVPPQLGNLSFLVYLNIQDNHFYGNLPNELGQLRRLRFINFSNNRFTGNIPPEIGKLPNLKMINMWNNSLSGSIPWSFYNISSLQSIIFGFNNLYGTLPNELCNRLPNLESLYLNSNQLFGQLPSTLGDCSQLQNLSLAENKFTGRLPENIGNLSQLVFLHLGKNNLKGDIPNEMGNLQNLESLYLGHNFLTGLIPPTIFNISTIKLINLADNDLSGRLPSSMGYRLPKLDQISLASNKLSGPIPNSISNASKLALLELGVNLFSGHIPNTFGNLRYLYFLGLTDNKLTTESSTTEWSFISALANCRELIHLSLSSNPLYGILPHSIGNISESLQFFYAYECKLMGSIPTEIGNLHSLITLSLYDNNLTGTIPATVGSLQQLQGLDLSNNNLQGFIPDDICHLKELMGLLLYGNKLHGPIPTCLASLISLREFYIDSNKLTSDIPLSLWTLNNILQINLSSNSLIGSLSSDVQNLKVLINLDLSMNQLSGGIPISIGGLKDLVNLSLAGNRFHGHIPESFGGLISLESLDLSDNNLDGEIPKSLEALSCLTYFNVSGNRLQGQIPTKGPFKNFSAQSFLSNYALCGSPRLQVPPCKDGTIKRSSKTITIVLKYALPPIISAILLVTIIIVFTRIPSTSAKNPPQEDLFPLTAWRRTSYLEIQRATDGFSECNLLGKGCFGSVYKGTLPDGTNIAVKVFNLQLERAFRSFDSECEVLRNIRHRNLVKILSSCSNIDFKALILEFMPNGSLEKWLYSHNYFLDILGRLNIMTDVALALGYLHHGQSAAAVVHCDLKPSNILLDENMVAHVSDFGISKLLAEGDFMTETLTMATIGYMAPEYGSEGIVSSSCDVYSYGILLMETFTRKKPTEEMFDGEMSLKNWVKNSLPHGLIEVVDANLLQEDTTFSVKMDCILSIMDLALDCSMDSPEQRISMIDAAAKLKKIEMRFVNDVGATAEF